MKKITKPISDWIRDQDEIVEPSAGELHYQTDFKQKTILGGFSSLAVTCYVLYMCYSNGRKMIELDNNNYVSLEQQMQYENVGQVKLSTMGKPLLEFLEGGDNTVLLTADDDKFINIRLNNVIKTFDENGDMSR